MRSVAAALILAALIAPAGARAASPSPAPTGAMYHKVGNTFSNPGSHRANPPVMNGQGCIANHPNASQVAINPITGKEQAAPLVSIPIGGGSVSNASTRTQQAHACARPRN